MMLLVVQEIRTKWTKASRGAPRASLRNAVPESTGIPAICQPTPDSAVLHHLLLYGERNDFSTPKESHTTFALQEELVFGCVRIYPLTNPIRVVFAYNMTHGGAPERDSHPKTAFDLCLNTWGKVVYNGRFSEGHDAVWTYQKTVCNVGVFERHSTTAFAGSRPISAYERLAKLR